MKNSNRIHEHFFFTFTNEIDRIICLKKLTAIFLPNICLFTRVEYVKCRKMFYIFPVLAICHVRDINILVR